MTIFRAIGRFFVRVGGWWIKGYEVMYSRDVERTPYLPENMQETRLRDEAAEIAVVESNYDTATQLDPASFVPHDVSDTQWLDGSGLLDLVSVEDFLWRASPSDPWLTVRDVDQVQAMLLGKWVRDHENHSGFRDSHAYGEFWSEETGFLESPCAAEFAAAVDALDAKRPHDQFGAVMDPQPRQHHRTPVAPDGWLWTEGTDDLTGWPYYQLVRNPIPAVSEQHSHEYQGGYVNPA
jgi:hypothetical protein